MQDLAVDDPFVRKQELVQQKETDVQEQQYQEQQHLPERSGPIENLAREESRARAVEFRAALTLQSAWRGRHGRALAEVQANEMLQQNQEELNTLLAELELQRRHSQLAELQRLESQLAELQNQKRLTLSPTAAEEGEPPAPRSGSSTSRNQAGKPSPSAQVQLTSPVRTTTWSPNFGRHPSAAVFKEKDDLRWSRPRREK